MPHKKNPDLMELTRGQTGSLIGDLTGVLSTLKALPSAYDKDLQGDKVPLFRAFDALMSSLPIMAAVVRTLRVHPESMAAALDEELMAADLADHLVLQGVPFRRAHEVIGRWVRLSLDQARPLRSFSLDELRALHPAFTEEVTRFLDPSHSVSRRRAIGGTAPESVAEQLASARRATASFAERDEHQNNHGQTGGRS